MLTGKKILLVDDNQANQMLAQIIMEKNGAETSIAWNGKEAVESMATGFFDLILMDLQMPVMDGYEATSEIRKANKVIPIVALTANTLSGEEEKCMALGMNGFMAKPFKEKELLKLIYELLQIRNTQDEFEPFNTYNKANKLYNLENLKTISGGNREFLDTMIEIFVNDVQETIAGFEAALLTNDQESISSIAHKIKPTLETFGVSFYEEIRRIEYLSETKENSTELEMLLKDFKAHLNAVLVEMKNDNEY
ncbi:MAG: response regulator [Bacteroidota bacterium]